MAKYASKPKGKKIRNPREKSNLEVLSVMNEGFQGVRSFMIMRDSYNYSLKFRRRLNKICKRHKYFNEHWHGNEE